MVIGLHDRHREVRFTVWYDRRSLSDSQNKAGAGQMPTGSDTNPRQAGSRRYVHGRYPTMVEEVTCVSVPLSRHGSCGDAWQHTSS